ncbi:MAG TPA: ribosome small subunit-dependent GTPase A [Pseudogracilibacillus sp.]|nr:ribosome small subunit-dependent GTPase A [Pseudogracilibacillus sp.]
MKEGQIINALSGFYDVQSEGKIYRCRGRGVFRNKKVSPLVGDFVEFEETNENEGYIMSIQTRRNQFKRPSIANITQAIIVSSAVEPEFSPLLVDRFLVLLEAEDIEPIIVISKKDVATSSQLEEIQAFQTVYEKLGYQIILTSFDAEQQEEETENINQLLAMLSNHVTVLVGQSGVGKSSFLNQLDPSLNLKTADISTSLGRGKHTTRQIALWEIAGGLVADTPGFSNLEFSDIKAENLDECFVEIRELKPFCKFRSCQHIKEPQCAVKQAVEEGNIATFRYEHYQTFLKEILSRKPRY